MVVHNFHYKMTCEGCATAARKKLEGAYGDADLGLKVVTTVADQKVEVTLPDNTEITADDLLSCLQEGDPNAKKL